MNPRHASESRRTVPLGQSYGRLRKPKVVLLNGAIYGALTWWLLIGTTTLVRIKQNATQTRHMSWLTLAPIACPSSSRDWPAPPPGSYSRLPACSLHHHIHLFTTFLRLPPPQPVPDQAESRGKQNIETRVVSRVYNKNVMIRKRSYHTLLLIHDKTGGHS